MTSDAPTIDCAYRRLLTLLYGFMFIEVFECKLTDYKKAFEQASRYSLFADRASIVMPYSRHRLAMDWNNRDDAVSKIGVISWNTDGM